MSDKPTAQEPTSVKVAYVRAQAKKRQEGNHTCHWPTCNKLCPPALWGCRDHWFLIPLPLRNRIWRAYRAGQEIDKQPSREYVQVAREIQEWIAEYLKEHPEA